MDSVNTYYRTVMTNDLNALRMDGQRNTYIAAPSGLPGDFLVLYKPENISMKMFSAEYHPFAVCNFPYFAIAM